MFLWTTSYKIFLIFRSSMLRYRPFHMVVVAQLAERLVVVQEVAGSSPVIHPNLLDSKQTFYSLSFGIS